ncbi:hypothetical protein BU26DRAFT_604361 [Trematosphaeria pertusa]|uniref:Uncharacterized protein n=1 Tax=Trematosphaeria pertusa TaxID=390896 RepID=A0A6A6IID4_9PLEO|nr:uncharacterized protein BU26DRAFT_604361 [Trematosphaeria pertusa]KAF2250126.1 hypothetical protein BU26DRAFT_604361 [Trematosphaeria pertusa]
MRPSSPLAFLFASLFAFSSAYPTPTIQLQARGFFSDLKDTVVGAAEEVKEAGEDAVDQAREGVDQITEAVS